MKVHCSALDCPGHFVSFEPCPLTPQVPRLRYCCEPGCLGHTTLFGRCTGRSFQGQVLGLPAHQRLGDRCPL